MVAFAPVAFYPVGSSARSTGGATTNLEPGPALLIIAGPAPRIARAELWDVMASKDRRRDVLRSAT